MPKYIVEYHSPAEGIADSAVVEAASRKEAVYLFRWIRQGKSKTKARWIMGGPEEYTLISSRFFIKKRRAWYSVRPHE